MCGIVGGVADRDVSKILIEGLHRLEYRGYDSAGLALIGGSNPLLHSLKRVGKVKGLEEALQESELTGQIGIAHTRWATHGKPNEANAHPHLSGSALAIVHNGIIENFEQLKRELIDKGYQFSSDTDSEVIVHLIAEQFLQQADIVLLDAVRAVMQRLEGAYALGVISADAPDKIVAARKGSPLVIGVGIGENFIGSDQLALQPVTNRFIFLEEGDMAVISKETIEIFDVDHTHVHREVVELDGGHDSSDKGEYRHHMLKEIYEQPTAIRKTLEGRLDQDTVNESAFGPNIADLLDQVKAVQIIACGTSYHAGLVAKYWFESIAKVPCFVEIASEFRYRASVVVEGTLFVTISQSGETADTLAALQSAKTEGYVGSLTICNVPSSSLVRESDISIMTNAGPEIGVASTKAFTTQLVALSLLVVMIGRRNGMNQADEQQIVQQLKQLPNKIEASLLLDQEIEALAEQFGEKQHALFLGRGVQYPVAMEGALKLKEISYIHAEAYAAGELKHGPLALVDADMPIITVAPNNDLLEKLKSNLQEVKARGGELYVFADADAGMESEPGTYVMNVPHIDDLLSPVLYTIPLQLLSYHVALIKGTDVDQPRNLAKSVTVE